MATTNQRSEAAASFFRAGKAVNFDGNLEHKSGFMRNQVRPVRKMFSLMVSDLLFMKENLGNVY